MWAKLLAFILLGISFPSQALNTPTMSSPSQGATINGFDVYLMVGSVTGATGYQFRYDTVSTLNSPWLKTDTTSITYTYTTTLRVGKIYYWQARAYKPGDTSLWTAVRNFSTSGTFNLSQPANNSNGSVKGLICGSAAYLSPVQYLFEADTTAGFNSPLRTWRIQGSNQFSDTNLFAFGRNIFWRAKAISALGDTLGFTPTWKYSIYAQAPIGGSSTIFMSDPEFYPSWTNSGLANIELCADTVQSFDSPILFRKVTAPASTLDTLKNMLFGKYYFYKVRAVYGSHVSAWSVLRTLQIYTNGNINNPYNGEKVNTLKPTFSWRQLKGTRSHFILYSDSLNTQVLVDTVMPGYSYIQTSWLKLEHKYYFRVRYEHEKDSSVWINYYFTTYAGQLNMSGVNNQATNVSVRPRFQFKKELWPNAYLLEIDTGLVFSSTPSSLYIRCDSFKYDGFYYHYLDTSLAYGQKYVWRVFAIMGTDTGKGYSYTFTTANKPVSYFPPNHYIGTGPSTNGLVTGVSGSAWIQWELDTNVFFQSSLKQTGIDPHVPDDFSPPYIQLNLPGNLKFHTTYYWRSRCINRVDTGDWSLPFDFRTTQEVWANSPTDGAINIATNPKLEWGIQGSTSEMRFQYMVGKDSNFVGTSIVLLPPGASPQATLSCQYGTKYYWRARAFHTQDTSHWSPVFRFTTVDAPVLGTPNLLSPAQGATKVPAGTIQLSWTSAANAITYEAQVAEDENFNPVLASGNAGGYATYFSGAQYSTRYYWRVRARYNELFGAWSTSRWFETAWPTGLEEPALENAVQIYPNPAHAYFQVSLPGDFDLDVYDLQGKIIHHAPQNKNEFRLNTSEWKKGMYLILIQQKDCLSKHKLWVE